MSLHPDLLPLLDADNDWKKAWELIHDHQISVNLCGKAGTGKSTFLRAIAKFSKKKVVFTAPTGIAALNIRGVTLHSFFGLPFGPLLPDDPRMIKHNLNATKKKIIDKMELLVIDEISMVRADVLDAIDLILRKACKKNIPFGGKQLLLVGDNFQLEPVVKREEFEILSEYYEHPYYFGSKAFQESNCELVELKTVYRQTDDYFISLLNKVRIGAANLTDLDELNSRVVSDKPVVASEGFSIILATRVAVVAAENMVRLARITHPQVCFKAKVEGKYNPNNFPTDENLILKKDAQVIMVKNDKNRAWVNGSLGKIKEIHDDELSILLETGKTVVVSRETWEQIEYSFDNETRKLTETVVGSFVQFPVKLAWAITIHKSQGLTFNNVILNMEGGAFAAGQLYVALSRCRTLEGIQLIQTIKPSDVIVKREVLEFAGLGRYIE